MHSSGKICNVMVSLCSSFPFTCAIAPAMRTQTSSTSCKIYSSSVWKGRSALHHGQAVRQYGTFLWPCAAWCLCAWPAVGIVLKQKKLRFVKQEFFYCGHFFLTSFCALMISYSAVCGVWAVADTAKVRIWKQITTVRQLLVRVDWLSQILQR